MTTQLKKKQAIFPDFPRNPQVVDGNGNLTSHWNLGLSNVFQALQKNYKNEGILIPILTPDEQAQILALYTPHINYLLPQNLPDISGQMIFDAPTYDAGVTPRVPKIFVITYKSDRTIHAVAWKSFTIT